MYPGSAGQGLTGVMPPQGQGNLQICKLSNFKVSFKIATDNIQKYFFFHLSEKILLTFDCFIFYTFDFYTICVLLLLIRSFTGRCSQWVSIDLIVLGFNDTSTLEGHFVSSPREREKRDRRESRGDEREGQGRKRNRNESEETEEIKTFPLYPYPLQG